MEATISRKAAAEAFIVLYDFHTKLYHNVLVDISDADAQKRLDSKANHIAWIAGSLVQERYELAKPLGVTGFSQTTDELFRDHKGIQDGAAYPSLAEYKKDWDQISPVLKDALINLSEEQWNGPDPYNMPGGNYSLFDVFTFCMDRESYCIGQIGLWRRLLGYDAMRYD